MCGNNGEKLNNFFKTEILKWPLNTETLKRIEGILSIEKKKCGIIEFISMSEKNILERGKIAGTNHYIYSKEGKTTGLLIEGCLEIGKIEIVLKELKKIKTFKNILKNGNTIFFYTEDGKYIALNIEEEIEFENIYLDSLKYDESGKPISGIVSNRNLKEQFFSFENGKYIFLNIEGEVEFEKICLDTLKYDESGKLISGTVMALNGINKYFYIQDGKYIFLKIENETEFEKIYFKGFTYDESGKLISGTVMALNGINKHFYIQDGKYIFLKIENETKFDDLFYEFFKKNENGELISGKVKNLNGEYKNFYLEDGEFKFKKEFCEKIVILVKNKFKDFKKIFF